MIINIAGTNGSGKSTLINQFLSHKSILSKEPVMKEGRTRPIGYDIELEGCTIPIHLMGAYDGTVDTAGCDTISNIRDIFDMIREQVGYGKHVLYEGAIVMNMTRGPELVADYPREVHVLELLTSLATCLAGIEDRRTRKGSGVLADKSNIESNYKRSHSYAGKMRQAGAHVHRVTRKSALDKLLELFTD